MDLTFEFKKINTHIYVTLHGEIDLHNAKQLKERILEYAERDNLFLLVLDLKGIKYIDSTGLGILIGLRRRMLEKNGDILLVYDSERLRKLFNITGLNTVFKIFNDQQTIEDYFKNRV